MSPLFESHVVMTGILSLMHVSLTPTSRTRIFVRKLCGLNIKMFLYTSKKEIQKKINEEISMFNGLDKIKIKYSIENYPLLVMEGATTISTTLGQGFHFTCLWSILFKKFLCDAKYVDI